MTIRPIHLHPSPHLITLNLGIILIIEHLDRILEVDPSQKWLADRIPNKFLHTPRVLLHEVERSCQVLVFLLHNVSRMLKIKLKLHKPVEGTLWS